MRTSLIKGSVADAVRLRRSSPVEIEDFSAGEIEAFFRGDGPTLSLALALTPTLAPTLTSTLTLTRTRARLPRQRRWRAARPPSGKRLGARARRVVQRSDALHSGIGPADSV